MNRETQSLIMLLVGGAVLRISVTDVYLRYVKEGLQPYLVISAVLLLIIGAVTLWRELAVRIREIDSSAKVNTQRSHDHESSKDAVEDDGHGHGHSGPRVAWLLLLPVFAIFLIAPPSLGSYAAERSGAVVVAASESDYPPLPSGDPVSVGLLDYASRAIWENGTSLRGRTIKLTGFISPRKGGGVYVTRMMLTCCASDALALKVRLVGDVPRKLKKDQWVEIVGVYAPQLDRDPTNKQKVASITVIGMRQIAVPSNPYEG